MNYQKVNLIYDDMEQERNEIIIAMLSQLPFESFTEDTDNGVTGYIPNEAYCYDSIMEALEPVLLSFPKLEISTELIKDQNWNEAWEKNFSPITIGSACHIRAPFHPENSDCEHEIIIEPKMSFGTGHHSTTFLMIDIMSEMNFAYKSVLDMGCGTGVLAIYASMLNAKHVTAIDIDSWAYENSIENIERNHIANVDALEGDAADIEGKLYDIILANINRNILLEDMEAYVDCLKEEGQILFSGFYTEDLPIIQEKALSLGLSFVQRKEKNNWVAALFELL